jgi:hypothetical protein
MLPRDRITHAVEIQHKSYKLLLWLAQAIDRGAISFTRSHSDANAANNAYEWIEEHFDRFPDELRPPRDCLREFSYYFGSYVTTSFDLTDEPGTRLESNCGCFCDLCARLVNASHLRPKKLRKRDKEGARQERISRLILLAQEEGIQLSGDLAGGIAAGPFLRDAAYSAYGQSLLERIGGSECGPYVLALWREIAWKPEGSPIKDFKLAANDFFEAEHRLIVEMKNQLRTIGLSQ